MNKILIAKNDFHIRNKIISVNSVEFLPIRHFLRQHASTMKSI